MMLTVLILVGVLAVLIDLAALIYWKDSPDISTYADAKEMPNVSILIPMRNEQANVKGLIDCIRSLDYPTEKIEVFIGDDRSEDRTKEYLENEIASDQRFEIIQIKRDLPGLVAKANVIAQLIPYCSTPYYFITDADVRVPKSWIKALVPYCVNNIGVVGGSTVVKVDDFWSALQNIDWLMAQGLLYVAGNKFSTLAVSGTNMMITRAACESIGGYQNIPYSLTEDIGFLIAARNHGFPGKYVLNTQARALIAPQPHWSALQRQRTRWIYGALRLPKWIVLLLLTRTLFLFFTFALACWKPFTALSMYLVKFVIDLIFINRVANRLNQKVALKHFVGFEAFSFLISSISLIKYLFSGKINWKGRSYL